MQGPLPSATAFAGAFAGTAHAPAPATVPATRRDDTETKAGEEVERKQIGRSSKPSPVEKPADKRAKALAKAPPNKQAKSAAKPAAHKPTTAAPAPAPAAAKKRGLFSKGRAAQPKPVVKSQPAPAAQRWPSSSDSSSNSRLYDRSNSSVTTMPAAYVPWMTSPLPLSAARGGNPNFRRDDLLYELTWEDKQLAMRSRLDALDRELHDAHATNKEYMEVRSCGVR